MRICYFGTYEHDYPRNAILIEGLRESGNSVFECHENIWRGKINKSESYSFLGLLTLFLRIVFGYIRLTWNYLFLPGHEVMMVGYIGQQDMPLAWLLARLRGVPLVFNPMLSLHDTMCYDRKIVKPTSLLGRALWLLDKVSCHLADRVILDTPNHVDYFVNTFHVPANKFRIVPIGADDRVFRVRPEREHTANEQCEILFVGKFIPLHGSKTIIEAAKLLHNEPIHFTLIGDGQEYESTKRMVSELGLQNITFQGWVDYHLLPAYYARADICLGIFGSSDKAFRVIPNKVYMSMAMHQPVLTADTPALRAELRPYEEVWVCQPSNPEDLATQIKRLADDSELRHKLAKRGYEAFQQRYQVRALGDTLAGFLAELVPGFAEGDEMQWGDQPEFYGPRHRFRESYLFHAIERFAPGKKVLDAACGAGTLVRRLSANGYEVTGLDLSHKFLTYIADQPASDHITLIHSDINHIPYESDSVDAVIAAEVLEHLQDDESPLQEFWRVLRPGGVCVISVPAEPSQWDWHDNWAGHKRRYRRKQLRNMLTSQGYKVVKIHHFGFPFTRAFHRFVYLPTYRRKIRDYQGNLDKLSTKGPLHTIAINMLFFLFQFDNLFNAFPLGIGLIAVAQKPLRKEPKNHR